MIHIMKEMQSPKKFNSPMKRRNLFAQQLPIPIRKGDTIIQGVPIDIQCNDNDTLGGTVAKPSIREDSLGQIGVNQQDNFNNSFILMNNEEDQRFRAGKSFGDENDNSKLQKPPPKEHKSQEDAVV